MNEPYELAMAASAARCVQDKLPETVATAVIEFVTGTLIQNPHRVGRPLRKEPRGRYAAARRGAYRVIYEIDDDRHRVTVLRVEHRADVYRPR